MSKKLVLVCSLLVAFCAGNALASHFWNSADGAWGVAGNWFDGTGATLPTAADDVYISSDGLANPRICNIPTGYDAVCNGLFGPAWDDNADATLNIASGASLAVGNWFQAANSGLNSLGKVTTAGTLTITGGLSTAYFGKSLFTVNGGSVYVGGNMEAAWDGLGRTTIVLNDGTMSVNCIGFLRGTGYDEDDKIIDLAGGTFVLRDATNLAIMGPGEGVYWINEWIAANNIVAYGGTGQVSLSVDGTTATLTGIIPEPATISLIGFGILGLIRKNRK